MFSFQKSCFPGIDAMTQPTPSVVLLLSLLLLLNHVTNKRFLKSSIYIFLPPSQRTQLARRRRSSLSLSPSAFHLLLMLLLHACAYKALLEWFDLSLSLSLPSLLWAVEWCHIRRCSMLLPQSSSPLSG